MSFEVSDVPLYLARIRTLIHSACVLDVNAHLSAIFCPTDAWRIRNVYFFIEACMCGLLSKTNPIINSKLQILIVG